MNVFCNLWNRWSKHLILPVLGLALYASDVQAQRSDFDSRQDFNVPEQRVNLLSDSSTFRPVRHSGSYRFLFDRQDQDQDEEQGSGEFPSPGSVLRKSMIIPGWGQIENRQIWKVPIIYGLFGGLIYYTVDLTRNYHDYRAAFYNRSRGDETDFRFGETPESISESITLEELRDRRNGYRNQRDMMYIYIGLAYGLNILDAYVYAHMRSFDVSDDLSASMRISPGITHESIPGIKVRIQLQPK